MTGQSSSVKAGMSGLVTKNEVTAGMASFIQRYGTAAARRVEGVQ